MAQATEVLLVGARVAQLKPHFEVRGYRCDAFDDGAVAMKALFAKRRDLVVLEINLGEQTAAEFVDQAKASEPNAAYLLLDDPSRAGQIVKALQAGVTHYLPTPPDEERLFRDAERLVVFSRALSGDLEKRHKAALDEAKALANRAEKDAREATLQAELVQQELEGAKAAKGVLEDDLTSLKRRIDELTRQGLDSASQLDELRAVSERAKKLADDKGALEKTLEQITRERDDALAGVEALEEKLATSDARAEEQQARAERLEKELEEQRALAKQRGDELDASRAAHEAAEQARAVLDDRVIDLELQVDELTTKVAFIEDQMAAADARVVEAEAHFKRERLRLIEEKQLAASGSSEAFQKMERLLDEVTQLRAAKADAEEKLRALERSLGDAAARS